MSAPGACRGCTTTLPPPFLDLGSTPLANAYVRPESADLEESVYPLALAYCGTCHLVQLTETVPPESLFSDYLYFSSYSDTFVAHARAMADQLASRFHLTTGSRVLEVASNDGYLLQFFLERGINVLGIEPARNVAATAIRRGIPTWNDFFGLEIVPRIRSDFGAVDLIVGNNVLAHVPKVSDFLTAVRQCLSDDGTAVFEFPYLGALLANTEFDTIYHEHVFYYSLSAVDDLARRSGLSLYDVSSHTVHGGSLRVFLRPANGSAVTDATRDWLAEERRTGLLDGARYRTFNEQVRALQSELLAHLHRIKAGGARLAAYGAPAKGNTLLNACGIGRELLDFTVDRNPHKQGLLLPGSRLPIMDPSELLRRRPDVTLILPWNIAGEIVAQQHEYLRAGGRFMVPIPHPTELTS